jgi:hypothetical protein
MNILKAFFEVLVSLFATHPTTDQFHVTSNGQAFFEPHDADNHAKSLADKTVAVITREDVENYQPEVAVPVEPTPTIVETPVLEVPPVAETTEVLPAPIPPVVDEPTPEIVPEIIPPVVETGTTEVQTGDAVVVEPETPEEVELESKIATEEAQLDADKETLSQKKTKDVNVNPNA